jgi:membrane protease YdiL (CAAX protease family)
MTAAATSPHRAPAERGAWAQFFAFVRRPVLPDRATGVRAQAFPVIGKLYLLDVLVMVTLMGAAALAQRMGLAMPDNLVSHVPQTPLVLGLIAVGAPLAEETLFRSWLSGRPGHIGALLALLLTAGLTWWMVGDGKDVTRDLTALGVLIGGLGFAGWWLWSRRKRPAWAWFQRHFAWLYYGVTAIFAAAHMTNFVQGMSWAVLPFTLPQFVVGLMLGHLRVRYGLWASVLLHALHNSLFVMLLLAST